MFMFLGEISPQFQIHTRVPQDDALSIIIFNCVLHKIMKEFQTVILHGTRLSSKNKGVSVTCLAFADNLILLATLEGIDFPAKKYQDYSG